MSFESPKKKGVETRSCPECGAEAKPRSTNCQKCGALLPLVNMPTEKEVGKAEILENTEIGRLDQELEEQHRLLTETSKRRFLKRKKIENKIKEINENIIRVRGEMRSNQEQEGKATEEKHTQTVDNITKSTRNTPEVLKPVIVKRIEILKPLVPDVQEGEEVSQNKFRDKFRTVKVMRSSGEIESDWKLMQLENGVAVVEKEDEKSGETIRKVIPEEELRALNSEDRANSILDDNKKTTPLEKKDGDVANISFDSVISYKGENYRVKETPNDENKNKYILEHATDKLIYKLTAEQLSNILKSGEAELVLPVEENKEDIARLQEIEELKAEEAELREAIENLRKQILALPDDEPEKELENEQTILIDEQRPEQMKKEVKNFSTGFMKERILPLLQNYVSEVKSLEIKGAGKEIILNTKVVKYNFNIGVEATLQNEGNGIGIKSYKIDAIFVAKGKAEREIAPQLNKVSDILREYIEKEEDRKVEKIEIENGELKVTFENK